MDVVHLPYSGEARVVERNDRHVPSLLSEEEEGLLDFQRLTGAAHDESQPLRVENGVEENIAQKLQRIRKSLLAALAAFDDGKITREDLDEMARAIVEDHNSGMPIYFRGIGDSDTYRAITANDKTPDESDPLHSGWFIRGPNMEWVVYPKNDGSHRIVLDKSMPPPEEASIEPPKPKRISSRYSVIPSAPLPDCSNPFRLTYDFAS